MNKNDERTVPNIARRKPEKEMAMQAQINIMAMLLNEIQKRAAEIDVLDRVKTAGAVGEIKYLSAEETIERNCQAEYWHLMDSEEEKKEK